MPEPWLRPPRWRIALFWVLAHRRFRAVHDGPSQQLGDWMRDQGLEAFEDLSARSQDVLVQGGVLTPAVFQSTPFDQVEITTELTGDHVSFLGHDDDQLHRFPRELFLMAGQLPRAGG